jgi:hypothetical protein
VSTATFAARAAGNSIEKHTTIKTLRARTDADPWYRAGGKPPPAIVAQDDFVAYRMIEGLYSDWTDAGRSAELHIYRRGNHGFGMVKQGSPSDRWINLFHEWLADQGLA